MQIHRKPSPSLHRAISLSLYNLHPLSMCSMTSVVLSNTLLDMCVVVLMSYVHSGLWNFVVYKYVKRRKIYLLKKKNNNYDNKIANGVV